MFSRPTTGSRQSKRSKMNATTNSFKTNKSSKSNKAREKESEAQKIIQQKLQEISNFQGEPPDVEMLLGILGRKNKD